MVFVQIYTIYIYYLFDKYAMGRYFQLWKSPQNIHNSSLIDLYDGDIAVGCFFSFAGCTKYGQQGCVVIQPSEMCICLKCLSKNWDL